MDFPNRYQIHYQPDLQLTLETGPYLQYESVLTPEQLAGMILPLLVLFDLNWRQTQSHLAIYSGDTLVSLENAIAPHLTRLSPDSILSARMSDSVKIQPALPTLNPQRYLSLLVGPASFIVVQFTTSGFIEGLLITIKLFNIHPEMISRVIDRTNRQVIDLS